MTIHYATCAAWRTGFRRECDCPPEQPWRVRRLGFRHYAVERWLDGRWTRFMTTRSRTSACELVASIQWLASEGLRRVG